MSKLLRLLALLSGLLLAACGGGGSSAPTPPPTESPEIVLSSAEPLAGVVSLSLSTAAGGSVTWYIDLVVLGSGDSISWDTALASSGQHLVLARITQPGGATQDLQRTVVVNNPTVHLSSSVSGTTGIIHVDVWAMSNVPVESVSATLDGAPIGTLSAPNVCSHFCTGGPPDAYRFDIDATVVGSGNHTVVITGTDANGSAQIAVPLPISNAPVVTLDSPPDGAVVSGVLQVSGQFATDQPGAVTVHGYLGDLPIVDTMATPFNVNYPLSGVTPGSYLLTLRVGNAAGQVTTVLRTIVVEASPPPVTLLFSIGGGQLLDADADHLLIQTPDQQFHIRSTSGADVLLQGAASILYAGDWQVSGDHSYVFGQGSDCESNFVCVYQWDSNGTRSNLSTANPWALGSYQQHPVAHDGYVLWSNDTHSNGSLTLYEVASGKYTRVPQPAGTDYIINNGFDFSVGANKVEVFYAAWASGASRVFHWDTTSAQAPVQISSVSASAGGALTDGTRVAWLESPGALLVSAPVAGGAPVTWSTTAGAFLLRDGVLAWTETVGGATVLKASGGGDAVTLATANPVRLYEVRAGRVLYAENGKLYSWSSSTGAATLLLDAEPVQAVLGGNLAYFTIGATKAVYQIPLP